MQNARALGHGAECWYGLSLGSVLLLAAIGLAITFGVMGVINMAHGEMVMIGAYVTFMVQEYIRSSSPGTVRLLAFDRRAAGFRGGRSIGILIEQSIIRFSTAGRWKRCWRPGEFSPILPQAVPPPRPDQPRGGRPSWMSGTFNIGRLNITYGRLWIIVFT